MFLRWLASFFLWVLGWKYETDLPKAKNYVLISWPHTSNWDGLLLCFMAVQQGIPLRWMVKKSVVDSPVGWLATFFGAVPIDRSKRTNMVAQMVERFKTDQPFVLAVPPEGTRKRTDLWKSGFYRIAVGAKVPIVCGYLDFARKRGGLGAQLEMTGNVVEDMDRIRGFYEPKGLKGRFPDQVGPIRLAEESDTAAA